MKSVFRHCRWILVGSILLIPITTTAVAPPSYHFRSTSTINETDGGSYTRAVQMASQTNTAVYRGNTVFTVKFSDATYHTIGAAGGGGGGGSYGGSSRGSFSGGGGGGGGISMPTFAFKTTSAYTPTVATSVLPIDDGSATLPSRYKKRQGDWDDPEDDPIGVLPEQTPIGSPYILLLFALLYLAFRRHTREARREVSNE